MAEKDNSPDMSLMDGAVDDIADVLLKSKMSSQRIAVVRQRRINPAISKVFGEVYNSRGKLNDMYRRKAVNSLHITESIPEHITQLDFISLIPNELRTDQRIVIDLVKRLSEAARHRQRIARANFIYRNEAQRLSEIFRECIHREDQCVRLAKLISDVRSERQWKGSMPSVEWFLRRKKGVVSSKAEKMDQQAAGPAAPNKLKRLLEISKTSNGDEERLKIPKSEFESPDESGSYTDYLKQVFLNSTATDFALNDKQDLEAKIEAETPTGTPTAMGSPNGVSTTIISTEELHFPSSSNSESGLLASTFTSQTLPNSLDRNIAIEKLETYFSRSTPDQIRHYMLRLRQAANRRLAEQAVDLISTLSSEECAQFLSDIDSDGVAGLN
ncbi:LPS-assembly protein LptD [Dirofilaria immitis]